MLKFVKLGLYTFFTAFVVMFLSSKADAMALEGTDENGRQVKVYNVDKYLKKNPYKTLAKKNQHQKPRPKPKSNPKPVKKESDEVKLRRIVRDEFKKKEAEEKKWNLNKAVKTTILGGAGGAVVGSIPTIGGGATPGALLGGAGGFAGYNLEWAYDNYGIKIIEGYKKVSKLEDPMGRWHP